MLTNVIFFAPTDVNGPRRNDENGLSGAVAEQACFTSIFVAGFSPGSSDLELAGLVFGENIEGPNESFSQIGSFCVKT